MQNLSYKFDKFEENLLNELGDMPAKEFVKIKRLIRQLKSEIAEELETPLEKKEKIEIEVEVSEVDRLVRNLGISVSSKGYKYVTYILAMEDVSLELITKNLYPKVAKNFNTTLSSVERGIRHAVECGSKNQTALYKKLFGNTRPTNTEFLAVLQLLLNK